MPSERESYQNGAISGRAGRIQPINRDFVTLEDTFGKS